MDLLIFLVVAAVAVWLFLRWRRRVNAPYRIEWLEGREGGQGYFVVRADGQRLLWDTLQDQTGGDLVAVRVAGVTHHAEALQRPEFNPGRYVALLPEPDNPHDPNAVGVWDARGRWQVGYIPAEHAPMVADAIQRDPDGRTIVMWEDFRDDERVGLRLLRVRSGITVAGMA